MAKKKHILERSREARDKIANRKADRHLPMDEPTQAKVLALVREGATLAEVCSIRHLTSWGKLHATRKALPEFADDMREAQAIGAEAMLGEAQEASKQASLDGNPDLMRVAESFARVTTMFAEKIAPREFGQLVKLGGHDGGALTLKVVNFAVPAIALSGDADVGKARQLVDSSRASLTEASFEELDA